MKRNILSIITALTFLLAPYISVFATDYYVDSVAGNDAYLGTSPAQAWQTIGKANNVALLPGDSLNLKAGSSFTVAGNQTVLLLQTNDSGSIAQPVNIRAYGTGAKPLLYQTFNYNFNTAVLGFYGGVSNVVIDGLHLKGITGTYSPGSGRDGIDVVSTALLANGALNSNVTIKNCEIEGGARGMLLYYCKNFTITNNDFHDITGVITNTRDWNPQWPIPHSGAALDPVAHPNGYDDDCGAEVIDLNSWCEDITITSNTVENCYYTSYDYGIDGTFIEVYGQHFKNLEIAYNKLVNMPGGTIEFGCWGGGATVDTVDFHHNIITEGASLFMIPMSGQYALADIFNVEFNNNTFVQGLITDDNLRPWTICGISGTLTDPAKLKVQNNIFYLRTGTKVTWMGYPTNNVSSIYGDNCPFLHKSNLWYKDPAGPGKYFFATPADATELTTNNPLFANLAADCTLTPSSPAVDAGTDLGYTRDLVNNVVYSGNGADMGAYESSATPATQPIVASTAGAEQAGNTKAQAYDGNVNTRWANDGTLATAWIQYDLGAAYNVNSINLMLDNNHMYTYPIKIQVGNGSTWIDVSNGSSAIVGYKTFEKITFAATSGRYVKITMTGASSAANYWLSITETQIFKSVAVPSVLQAIIASTAGSEQAGNTKAQSYDASDVSRWCNDGTLANGWIQYDLGATYNVSSVKLMLENNHILTYPIKIQVGNGTTWTDAFVGSSALVGWKQFQTFTFTPKSGRYVKVLLTGTNSQGYTWFSSWESQIYRN